MIVLLAADGFSDQEIAERLGCTDRTGSKWRRSHGVVSIAAVPARGGLPVLLYHHVGPRRGGTLEGLTVEPERFAAHLQRLRRLGYRSASVADVVRWAHDGEALPPRSVMITFDDGYADLAEFAFPVLRDAGLSATVFIVTGLLGGTSAWDEPVGGGAHRLLDAAAIATWSKQGIEFGVHTRSHANLARLPAPRVEEEVVGSRADLEAVVGGPVHAFAYPWGAADERVRAVVVCQFSIAFERIGGMNFDGADPHRLRRSMVLPSDAALDISLRVRLGFSPRQRARARIAGARRRLLRERAPTGAHAS